jgi:hypothetical protein
MIVTISRTKGLRPERLVAISVTKRDPDPDIFRDSKFASPELIGTGLFLNYQHHSRPIVSGRDLTHFLSDLQFELAINLGKLGFVIRCRKARSFCNLRLEFSSLLKCAICSNSAQSEVCPLSRGL